MEGKRLKKLLGNLGVSQPALAPALGYWGTNADRTMRRVIAGKHRMNGGAVLLMTLLERGDVTLEHLLEIAARERDIYRENQK